MILTVFVIFKLNRNLKISGYILLELIASDIIMKKTSRFVHKTDEYIPQTTWNFLSKNDMICTISKNLAKVYLEIKNFCQRLIILWCIFHREVV